MYPGEEPGLQLPHYHHLLKVDDDDDDDNNQPREYDPHTTYPPSVEGHHPPPLPATPQQPHQTPKPLFSPRSRPPSRKGATPPPPEMSFPPAPQPLQPPQPIFLPTSPPPKPWPQPHHDHVNNRYDDDNNHHHEYDPHTPYPHSAEGHHQPLPPATPQQPLQPPKPLFSPRSRPPSKKGATPPPPEMSLPPAQQPLQPPQPIFLPTSPPKPWPQPHHPHVNNRNDDDDNHPYEYDPHTPYPPSAEGHHQPASPATPQQPLQLPKPLFSPRSHPPSKKRATSTATPAPPEMSIPPAQQPLQPPQSISFPTSPPHKPQPTPHHQYGNNRYDDDNNRHQQLIAVITIILLLLLGLTALILWLLYRPSKPHFTAVSAVVYSLNTTSLPPYVTASLQITVLTRNPSKRTSLYYDNLAVTVHYYNHPITPTVTLPPLHHLKKSTVMMSPAICGGLAVAVPPEVVDRLAADEAYGVVGLSWVLVGRVKYSAGWFRSGYNRVYVRCDVMVGFKSSGGNPSGQVPLLGNPPCFVDM